MELVPGTSLEKLMGTGTPVNVQPALGILRPIADALDHAHSEGVVHRDIKPANILVRPDGKVKITDFGIARVVSQTLTKTGVTTGTPAYMSPEQIISSKVDGKADQFSLAVMAYELLGGGKPFEADAPHTLMMQIMNDEPEPIDKVNPALPRECSTVFQKAMAKKAAARYDTCSEFIQALAGSLEREGGPTPSLEPVFPEAFKNAAPSRRSVVIGAVTVGLLAGSGLFIWRGRPAEVPADPAATVREAVSDKLPNKGDVKTTEVPAVPVATVPAAAPDKLPKKGDAKPTEVAAAPVATVPVAVPDKLPKKVDVKPIEVPAVQVATVPNAVPDNRPKKGDVKTNSKDGLRYVWIAPGSFQMGCSPGDGECREDEKPPAEPVTLTKGYWLGETEVTQAAFEKVIGNSPSHFKGSDLPVESVNWNQAKSYCEAIGGRLPTEAEWEYAARGGNTSSRYGDIDQVGWYDNNSGQKTHSVRGKRANSFGLYDMLGNVWEWTGDRYTEKLSGGPDPTGPTNGERRVLRGGSWVSYSRGLRASSRFRVVPTVLFDIGFRCAWE